MTAKVPSGFDGVKDALVGAADAKITQVVALVDGMDNRGAADALIAPLRSRLSELRPARPPRLSRLIYLPLDPLIVPADQWRPELPRIPRFLLPHLTAHIERKMGPRAAELAAAVRNLPPGDEWAVDTLGAMLWPEAGRLMAGATFTDEEIAASGMAAADHRALVPAMATLLRLGADLRGMAQRDRLGTPPVIGDLRTLLEAAKTGGTVAFRLMVTLLLKQYPHVQGLFGLAEHLGGGVAMAQVARDTVKAMEGDLASGKLDCLAPRARCAEIGRLTALLASLERSSAGGSVECRPVLAAARAELDRSCRASFDALLNGTLLARVAALTGAAADDEINSLEDTARNLRAMELTARALGDAAEYQAKLDTAARALHAGPNKLQSSDRARLIEIIAGPETAAACLVAA